LPNIQYVDSASDAAAMYSLPSGARKVREMMDVE
jgi:hypothetical protein